jgi:hypothetical protein
MNENWSLKKRLLQTLIAALVTSALVGSYAFMFGDFGETEAKILLTTLSISYFSVTSLACAAVVERRKGGLFGAALGTTGIAVSAVGFLLFVPGIWAELWDSDALAKTMIILAIFAFSIAQICLLILVPLKRSVLWVFYATAAVILGLATFASGMIIVDAGDEWVIRIAGVLGILDGCGSVVIPVLYKLGDRDGADRLADCIELICPRCGRQDVYRIGAIQCSKCRLEISIRITGKPNAAYGLGQAPQPPKIRSVGVPR